MDITFQMPEGRFNYRAAGIILHKGKVLVMRDDRSPYYYLPGGRISLHESSGEALARELLEELRTETEIQRLCYIVESFFVEEVTKEKFHEVALYYLLKPSEELLGRGEAFTAKEGNREHRFYWKSFAQLRDLYFQPAFLKERLNSLPAVPAHLIISEYQREKA